LAVTGLPVPGHTLGVEHHEVDRVAFTGAFAVAEDGQGVGVGHGTQPVGMGSLDRRGPHHPIGAPGGGDLAEVHPPVRPAHEIVGGTADDDRAIDPAMSGQPAEAGSGEELKAHHGRDRIAGKPEHRHLGASQDAEGEGFGRFDRHLHRAHAPGSQTLQRELHQITISHADPAADHQSIAVAGAASDRRGDHPHVVTDDPEVDRLASGHGHLGHQEVAVGVPDPGRAQGIGAVVELVPGGQHPDPGSGTHADPFASQAGQDPDVRRPDHRSRRQHLDARGDVLAGVPDVGAPRGWVLDDHRVPSGVEPGVLEHADGVGPGGNRRPGHDPDRFARLDPANLMDARHHHVGEHQPGRGITGAGGQVGETVDGRVVKGRDRDGGDDALGEHAADNVVDTQVLRRQREASVNHVPTGLVERDHR
jgi:hypothetical protein